MRLVAVFLFLTCVQAFDEVIHLDYASYRGASAGGVASWKGIRYAASPVNELRFASPQRPTKADGIQSASRRGAKCLAVGDTPAANISEDCLFLDVYTPDNATADSRLPVLFYITGGGYNSLDPWPIDGTNFVRAASNGVIVVTANYRVGPYGFLSGEEASTAGSLNNGIEDQIMALQWTHDYIDRFGGDPAHVTLGGVSAGAGSAAVILSAYNGVNETLNSLYHAVIGEEPEFVPFFEPEAFQPTFDSFAKLVNCSGNNALDCLRSKSIIELQKANKQVPLPGAKNPPLYTWGPTIDGTLVTNITYTLLKQGRFNRVPSLWGDDANGGATFILLDDRSVNSSADVHQFLANNYPTMSMEDMAVVDLLYNETNVPQLAHGAALKVLSPFYNVLGQIFDDVAFRCPAQSLSSASVVSISGCDTRQTWNYVYNVTNPTYAGKVPLGASHAEETNVVFGVGAVGGRAAAVFSSELVNQAQAYFVNFVKHFDPNVGQVHGTTWQAWSEVNNTQLWFQNAVNESSNLPLASLQRARCDFWQGLGSKMLL